MWIKLKTVPSGQLSLDWCARTLNQQVRHKYWHRKFKISHQIPGSKTSLGGRVTIENYNSSALSQTIFEFRAGLYTSLQLGGFPSQSLGKTFQVWPFFLHTGCCVCVQVFIPEHKWGPMSHLPLAHEAQRFMMESILKTVSALKQSPGNKRLTNKVKEEWRTFATVNSAYIDMKVWTQK